MPLSDEEKATLEALTKKANEPDEDDFAIEIWDETGAGAKVPFSKGQDWLRRFGIGVEPPADDKTSKPKPADSSGQGDKPAPPAQRYFGSKKVS